MNRVARRLTVAKLPRVDIGPQPSRRCLRAIGKDDFPRLHAFGMLSGGREQSNDGNQIRTARSTPDTSPGAIVVSRLQSGHHDGSYPMTVGGAFLVNERGGRGGEDFSFGLAGAVPGAAPQCGQSTGERCMSKNSVLQLMQRRFSPREGFSASVIATRQSDSSRCNLPYHGG